MVKFCANIVRNGKMLLVSIFVDALTQRFAPLYFIAFQNIVHFVYLYYQAQGINFAILGENSQILSKNREKLENIVSIHNC